MFVGHHWAAAVLALVASIGWIVQGLGHAFYYRQVCGAVRRSICFLPVPRFTTITTLQDTRWKRYVHLDTASPLSDLDPV